MKQYLLLTAASLTLVSCSSFKDYIKPDAPEGTAKIDLAAESDVRYKVSEPVVEWWKEFDDAKLSNLVSNALNSNLDIRIAIANLQQSRALSRSTRLDRLPTVTADGSYNRQLLSQESGGSTSERSLNNYEAGLNASWEIDLFGRVSQRIEAQEALEDAALADLENVYVLIAAEVATTYIELRGAQHRLSIAERNRDIQKKTFELTKTLNNGGRATALDVTRAQTQLDLTRATIPPLQAQVYSAVNRLSVLTGKVPDALREELTVRNSLPSLPNQIAVGNAADLIKRRPDIRSAERELASSIAQYNVAVTELFPTVDILGTIGFVATNFASLGTSALAGSVGPTLNWRAFDLGRVRAEIDQADAASLSALAEYERTVLNALEETQTALSDFVKEESRRFILQSAARSAKESANLARQRFDQGIDDFLDVLEAEATLLEAEDSLAQSEIAAATDLIAIYKALSGGWSAAAEQ